MSGPDRRVLMINCGSFSLKAAVYDMGATETRRLSLEARRIGIRRSRMRIRDERGASVLDREDNPPDHEAALRAILDWVGRGSAALRSEVVGHRVPELTGWHWTDSFSDPGAPPPQDGGLPSPQMFSDG